MNRSAPRVGRQFADAPGPILKYRFPAESVLKPTYSMGHKAPSARRGIRASLKFH